jgi:hypothetical protein
MHYVYILWNGNNKAAVVKHWQYFMEIHIREHLECVQKSEDDCCLATCESRTLITVAWKI